MLSCIVMSNKKKFYIKRITRMEKNILLLKTRLNRYNTNDKCSMTI